MGQCLSCFAATTTDDEETRRNETDGKVAKESTRLNHVEPTQADRRNETEQQGTRKDPEERKEEEVEAKPNEQRWEDVEDDAIQADTQQNATEIVPEIEESDDLGREVATSQDGALSLSEDEIEQDILVETLEREKGNEDGKLQGKRAEDLGIVNGAKVLLDIPKLKRNLPRYFGWSAASATALYVLSLFSFELLSFLAIDLLTVVAFYRQREVASGKNASVAATEAGASFDMEFEITKQDPADVCSGTPAAEFGQPENSTRSGGQTEHPAVQKSAADGDEDVAGTIEKREGKTEEDRIATTRSCNLGVLHTQKEARKAR